MPRAPRPILRRLRVLGLAALTASVALAIPVLAAAPATAASSTPLKCDQDTIYGIDGNRLLTEIDVRHRTTRSVATMAHNNNALGVDPEGTHAYAFGQNVSSNIVDDYDGTASVKPITVTDANVHAIRGAVDPTTHLFYYAKSTPRSTSPTSTYLGVFDPATGQTRGQVAQIRVPKSGDGGDMAFSASGDLYFLTGNLVYRISGPIPTQPGSTVLTGTVVAELTDITGGSPGLAFAGGGYLYLAVGTGLVKLDPTTGEKVGTTIPLGTFSASDLASCSVPDTVKATIAISGRVHPTDQWSVRVDDTAHLADWPEPSRSATTSGIATGLQPSVAGPVLALAAKSYTATQSMTHGDPVDYVTTWTCSTASGAFASGSGATATFMAPDHSAGPDVDCRFTNSPRTADVTWTAALPSGRAGADDQLRLAIHPDDAAAAPSDAVTTTGSGTAITGTAHAVAMVQHPVVLTADAAAVLTRYDATATCTDAAGLQAGLPTAAPFSGFLTFTPVAGAQITCTLTATPKPGALTASVALGGPRFDGADQFAVAVRDAAGTSLGTAATTGTGGTASTGAASVPAGSTVTITSAPTAHPARYASWLTCTDATGYTAGLPTHAPFSGSATIAPAAASTVACTVAVEPAVPDLTVALTAPDRLAVGAPADYRLVVGNEGGRAGSPTVRVRLPAGVTLTGADGTGWTCTATGTSAAGQLATCGGPAVAPVGSEAVVLHVLPTVDASGDAVAPRASVDPTGGTAPADPADCSGAACATAGPRTVASGVALGVTAIAPKVLVRNVPAQYVLRVVNTGTGPSTGAVLVDVLPPGVRFTGAQGAECTADDRVVTCTVDRAIGPGGTADVVLQVLPVDVVAGADLENRVGVGADGGTPAVPSASGSCGDACDSVAAPVKAPGLVLSVAVRREGSGPLRVGDVVRYAYTVTNAGAVAIERIALSDGAVCPSTSLAPGASMTCLSPEHTVTQDEVDRGGLAHGATASGAVAGCTADCSAASNRARVASVTASVAHLRLVQTPRLLGGGDRAQVGDTVEFRGRVTNTGTVRVTGLRVEGTTVDLACATTTLAPGASTVCTGRYVLTARDVDGRVLANTAVATGTGASLGAVRSVHRTASLAAGEAPPTLAFTGSDLLTPLLGAGALALVALLGGAVLLLRRRTVRLRR